MEHRIRERWADVGRGAAIITIVFFHSVLQIDVNGEVDWKIWVLIFIFSPIPIALFFFISGLFSKRIVEAPWGHNLTSRLVGLAYVFAIWSLIDFVISYLLVGELRAARSIWAYLIDPKSVLWFIWALMIFTTLANLVWRRWRKTTLLFALAISMFSFSIPTSSFVYENLMRFFPFFLVGLSGASFAESILFHRAKVLAVSGVVYASLMFFYVRLDGDSPGAHLIWFIAAWTALPLSVAASSIVADTPLVGNLVSRLGRASLPIYVAHETVIRLVLAGVLALIGPVDKPQLLSVFAIALAVIIVTAGFAELSIRRGPAALYMPPDFRWRRFSGAG